MTTKVPCCHSVNQYEIKNCRKSLSPMVTADTTCDNTIIHIPKHTHINQFMMEFFSTPPP